jgi:hypothetical protein
LKTKLLEVSEILKHKIDEYSLSLFLLSFNGIRLTSAINNSDRKNNNVEIPRNSLFMIAEINCYLKVHPKANISIEYRARPDIDHVLNSTVGLGEKTNIEQ